MTPRQIIAEAWAITMREHSIRRWGYASALSEMLRSVEILLYQAYFLYWHFKGVTVGWLSVELLFFRNLPFFIFVSITIFLLILLILEIFVPTLASGAIIGLAAKSYKKEEVRGGLILALSNFLPILEIHGLFILSGVWTMVTAWSLILRYGGEDMGFKSTAFVILGMLWIFSLIFRFFASFAEEGVVIYKYGIFTSIGKSFKIIISHLGHVMFLLLLMLVITLRIFINVVMVFLAPFLAIGLGLLLATFLPLALSYFIASVVGLALLLLLSYLLAYLHIFKQTVWTLTYMELSKMKDLDIIEEKG
ncbi:hypothetical protein A2635_01525 [Candidatus Peribacteria bacterium RIFCSPHIGHO2_01_FULL_51_9]|nr:MAG: hypothetical protein A2635_01525 [Candidatus Peribacteria bacterium RIFCSPHIGHO2_01_FULL_51_9]